MIACCNCGLKIIPNNKNMCEMCIIMTSNLTSKIKISTIIETCRGCNKYFIPPSTWKFFEWGSQELLIFCLERNKTIKKLNIVDSNFIYTEEHSKKMIIEIKIVECNTTQQIKLNYTIRNKQCRECMRLESKQFWNSLVQIRQHPPNPRSFLYLEQLIKIHKAHKSTSNIKDKPDGIDFYFFNKNDAIRFTKFIENFCGIKIKESNRLISEDRKNNTANTKTTFSCVLMPFCKDDLVEFNNTLWIVSKVNCNIELVNIKTGDKRTISAKYYFANEDWFKIIQTTKDLIQYTVVLSYKSDDFYNITLMDMNEKIFEIQTLLKVDDGDTILGYMAGGKLFKDEFNTEEIIIVRKFNNYNKPYKLKIDKILDRNMRLFLDDVDKSIFNEICSENDQLSEKLLSTTMLKISKDM